MDELRHNQNSMSLLLQILAERFVKQCEILNTERSWKMKAEFKLQKACSKVWAARVFRPPQLGETSIVANFCVGDH